MKIPFVFGFFSLGALAQAPMETFVSDLLGKMSLEEKIGQLSLYTSDMDVTGAKINAKYKNEIKAGRVGSIFNAYTPKFTRELQDLAVKNSRHHIPLIFGYDVIHGHRTIFPIPLAESSTWDLPLIQKTSRISAQEATADGIHWIYAPMVDIARDPRWGRIAEGAGEDPYLGSRIAEARVRGIQGKSLSDVDSALASVKHFAAYGAARGGRDYHVVSMGLPELFEVYLPPFRAAAAAGAATFMVSFNEINGQPSSSNKWLLEDILRKSWGWEGLVTADYTSIAELVEHGTAVDRQDAALQALRAGVDIDMQGGDYAAYLAKLVKAGKLSVSQIDRSVRRVLEAKYKLGLFQNPYKNCDEERAKRVLLAPENLAHAANVARQSIVLLKNNGALPLKTNQKIALIGPMANNQRDQIGSWSAAGDWKQVITLKRGLEEYIAKHKITAQITYRKGANLVDDPVLVKFFNDDHGNLEVDAKSPAELVKEAVEVARNSDVVVLALGEPQGMTGEAASRSEIRLPPNQLTLLRALVTTQKPVVLVLNSGRPLVLQEENTLANAMVQAWYLGLESGHAIADTLFGTHNPSGKLTVSFPYNEGQIPVFYGQQNTGRPEGVHTKYASRYLDVSNEALFPFGWGLSYSRFKYGTPRLSARKMKRSGSLTLSVTVTNAGNFDGAETVQLYLHDLKASMTRPKLQLKNFQKIFLKRGESTKVNFTITEEDLKFFNETLVWQAEAGGFRVFVGGNSRDLKSLDFELL